MQYLKGNLVVVWATVKGKRHEQLEQGEEFHIIPEGLSPEQSRGIVRYPQQFIGLVVGCSYRKIARYSAPWGDKEEYMPGALSNIQTVPVYMVVDISYERYCQPVAVLPEDLERIKNKGG